MPIIKVANFDAMNVMITKMLLQSLCLCGLGICNESWA